MKQTSTQIVLLGGGYVSVWAYRSLMSRLRTEVSQGRVQITVICPNTHHAFHGWTAESLTGIIQRQHQASPLAEVLPKARLVQGEADAIDTDANTVSVKLADGSRRVISYDHILLGIGSADSDVIVGIREYGYQVKAPAAFQRTRQKIRQLVQQAAVEDAETARQLLTFTIAGGGFTGVELAGNLAEYLDVMKKQYPSLTAVKPTVRLIHSGDRILAALQPTYGRLVRYAEKTLAGYGVEVLANRRITRVTETGVFLDDDSFVAGSMLISTVGQSQIRLPGTEMMPRDETQRLYTNANQQLIGYTNVWGGGDACHVKHIATNDPCPTNALWAIKHGEYAVRNIARAMKGQPLKPFSYWGLGQSASLGLGKGISELYTVQITGPVAWLMRWFFFHYFMPSRQTMLGAVSDWLYLLVRGQRKGLVVDEQAAEQESLVVSGTLSPA